MKKQQEFPPLMTVSEVSVILHQTKATIRRYIRQGILKAVKVGRMQLIACDSVSLVLRHGTQFLARQVNPPTQKIPVIPPPPGYNFRADTFIPPPFNNRVI